MLLPPHLALQSQPLWRLTIPHKRRWQPILAVSLLQELQLSSPQLWSVCVITHQAE